MFGYVTIDKLELKVREYYKYRGYYCGLCTSLKDKYSQLGRFTLNYDMTFLILVLSSLYEVENTSYNKRCIVHPLNKRLVITNEITEYAAAMNIILAYYSCKDNWADEKDLKSLLYSQVLNKDYKRAVSFYEKKAEYIKKCLDNITKLEEENTDDLDAISNEFGNLMAELMLYKDDYWKETLSKVGFFLGKYIYILDAYIDMEDDRKSGSFNPFLSMKLDNNIDKFVNDILILNLSFLNNELDKLPLIQDKGIIDNIIYSGITGKLRKFTQDKESINERSI